MPQVSKSCHDLPWLLIDVPIGVEAAAGIIIKPCVGKIGRGRRTLSGRMTYAAIGVSSPGSSFRTFPTAVPTG
jgi:hypothetical protein